MKLWEKGIQTDKLIEKFTVGKDRELDMMLAGYDVIGSLAHLGMLHSCGLLDEPDTLALRKELLAIYRDVKAGKFLIEEGVEDVHSQVELLLTRKLGEAGKKIHMARSRNDQVLVDLKLFMRDAIEEIVHRASCLADTLLNQGERYQDILIPGFTHLQVAMPSSFGLWFGAWAECIAEDLQLLQAAYWLADLNPLGSGAGYGSSFPIDRQVTTSLMGFGGMHINVVNAQLSRGRTERAVAFAMAALASTVSRMAGDVCLFASQNFNLVRLPDEFTTGSSIMPHKKNPDVFELLRARCNKIQALPVEIGHIMMNLPSGYFRDMQMIKESFLPVFEDMKQCLEIAAYAVSSLEPVRNSLDQETYQYIYSVEEVNRLVMEGMPFREAYREVARRIAEHTYSFTGNLEHTHVGSIGNPGIGMIREKLSRAAGGFHFEVKDKAIEKLLSER